MKVLPQILFAVAFCNFVIFVTIAVMIGGDAINGKVENGRYFLADHGRLTEVSAALYTYSLWHARSLFVTHPIGLVAMGIVARKLSKHLKTSK